MKKIIIFCLFAVATACSVSTRQDVFMGLYKGMPQSDALSSMTTNSSAEYSVDVKSGKVRVFVYEILVGVYQESVPGQDKTRSVGRWDRYYLAFQNGMLVYHGFLYEFLRHNHINLNEIGLKIKEHEEN